MHRALNQSMDTAEPLAVTDDFEWIVLHARPRCEKKIILACEIQPVRFYLPLQQTRHRYGGRQRDFEKPLFPGYVFCQSLPKNRIWFKQNQLVANVLVVEDQQKLVDQLNQIQRALEAGRVVEVMPYLEAGRPVKITGGPLKGLEGVIDRQKGDERFVIHVEMIQQSLALEIDSSLLSPA